MPLHRYQQTQETSPFSEVPAHSSDVIAPKTAPLTRELLVFALSYSSPLPGNPRLERLYSDNYSS